MRTCVAGKCGFACNAGFNVCQGSSCVDNRYDFESNTVEGWTLAVQGYQPSVFRASSSARHGGARSVMFHLDLTPSTQRFAGIRRELCDGKDVDLTNKSVSAWVLVGGTDRIVSGTTVGLWLGMATSSGAASDGEFARVAITEPGRWHHVSGKVSHADASRARFFVVVVSVPGKDAFTGDVYVDDVVIGG